jgi:uncharacterized protein YbjT (DUF2867 family)
MSTLVLGGTGRLGPHIVRALVLAGDPVTVLVRDREKAAAMLPAEAVLAVGDFADVDRLVHGIDTLVLLTPHGPDMARLQLGILDVAKRHELRVVKISGTSPLINARGPDACRQHWEVEQVLQEIPGAHVTVRPNAFAQGLVAGAVAEARSTGGVSDPIDGAGINAVDCRDVGEVVARVATGHHESGSTLEVTGPRSISYPELAELISDAGIPADARPGSPRQSGDRLRSLGFPDWEATHLEHMLERFASGAADFTTNTVAEITGHEPRTVEDLVRQMTA